MTAGKIKFGTAASAGTIKLEGTPTLKAGSYKANADLAASGNVTVDTATFTKADGTALELSKTVVKANNGHYVDANLVLKGGMDFGSVSVNTINASEGFAKLKDTEKTANCWLTLAPSAQVPTLLLSWSLVKMVLLRS